MAGQMVVLEGVTAAAAPGAPRINVNAPDIIAAKISTLKHAFGARGLTAAPGGGVVGRCRATGKQLIPKGSSAASLVVTEIAGRLGLGVSGTVAAGLALPAGSLTSSYTLVAAVNLASADVAGGLIVNFLSGFDAADGYISVLQRTYGVTNTGANKGKLCSSPLAGGNFAVATLPAAGWAIFVVDYDGSTRIASVAVNQVATFDTLAMPGTFLPPSGSYLEVGYHLDSNSLRSSKMGDLYTFSDSLLKTDLGKSQLAELVASMKTYYSIA
ncbi:hypothetical protein I8746_05260 [Pseudomonas sp. USTB-Z]|uniref:hypothetical protein n=1 Tax=Pseudomonas sp. USTB-Z TaxID=2794351 RepID=UPI001C839C4F|nr:hypothetical protein [Pseudomonas sp. USTB-Z]MBX6689005.1 hypothetical protein [Pseudomonas sp. USTB-Z]